MADEALGSLLERAALVEVVGAEFVVGDHAGEDVVGGGQDRVPGGPGCLPGAATAAQAGVSRGEVAASRASRGLG